MYDGMKVLGIISEYNPFHNGHLYHLKRCRQESGAEFVVCVMSGNFIQRGEPALADKWARAEMALLAGVDLVVELPVVYAMASAEFFAFGGVKILSSLGVVDFLGFGSEAGELGQLDQASDILLSEPQEYRELLKDSLSRGISFPAAREEALAGFITSRGQDGSMSPGLEAGILGGSNNILGVEYLKALKRLNSSITPITVRRSGSDYNSESLSGPAASATAIRKAIWGAEGKIPAEVDKTLPPSSRGILEREFALGRGPVFPSDFQNIVLSALRRMTISEVRSLPYIAEGLENRFKRAADEAGSLDDLINAIATKRYTRTRLQRSLFSILTGLTIDELDSFNLNGGPRYIRLLAFNDRGRQLLSQIGKASSLPVITKTADFKQSKDPLLSRMLAIEAASTNQYVLAFKSAGQRLSGQDFTRNPIYK